MFDGDIKPVREEGGVRSNTSVPVRSGWSAGMGPILHASLLHEQAIVISEYISVGLESGGSSRCPTCWHANNFRLWKTGKAFRLT